jgi:hypothetical protein
LARLYDVVRFSGGSLAPISSQLVELGRSSLF